MAVTIGMPCIYCEKHPVKRESHFCSRKCRVAYMKTVDGPVQCDGGDNRFDHCGAECDTVAEAKGEGWNRIRQDPEGISYNYTGTCQECQS